MVLLLVAAGGVVSQALRLSADRQRKITPGQPVTITISSGESSAQIGQTLTDAGVVDSVGRFRAAAEDRGLDGLLKPGTYQLVTGMDIDAVLDRLAKGPSVGVPFTIPEGFTVTQIVDRIAATKQFSKAELEEALQSKRLIAPYRPEKVKSLEGMLFPDTYAIAPDVQKHVPWVTWLSPAFEHARSSHYNRGIIVVQYLFPFSRTIHKSKVFGLKWVDPRGNRPSDIISKIVGI